MEIENYKSMANGFLKAKFDVTIPEWGLTIRDCCLFDKNGTKWISFPSRSFKDPDGSTKYFSFVSMEKNRKARFEAACLEKIATMAPQEQIMELPSNDLPF